MGSHFNLGSISVIASSFSHDGQESPGAISTAGKPRGFISVVYSSLGPQPNDPSFGGAVFAGRRRECRTECFIHSISPVSGYDPLSTQPCFPARREGPIFHQAFSQALYIENSFLLGTRLCVGKIGNTQAHIPETLRACAQPSCQGL